MLYGGYPFLDIHFLSANYLRYFSDVHFFAPFFEFNMLMLSVFYISAPLILPAAIRHRWTETKKP